jgi:hypothetical protein
MNTVNKDHLNENRILMAVVDDALLPTALKSHLAVCAYCRSQKEAIERNFLLIGQKAREMAPLPAKRIHLPVSEPQKPIWRYVTASAFSILLAAAIGFWMIFPNPSVQKNVSPALSVPSAQKNTPSDLAAEDAWEDEIFMTEISVLSENALPEEYSQLAATADLAEFDEEFFDYIVPETNISPLSGRRNAKGGPLC